MREKLNKTTLNIIELIKEHNEVTSETKKKIAECLKEAIVTTMYWTMGHGSSIQPFERSQRVCDLSKKVGSSCW